MARILVVDDEVGIRELLFEILYDEGHTVELAENAAAARQARSRTRFDLVLLDIWMPDTDGVSLLKEWVATEQLENMPVIMMSGHATIDTAVEATRIGAIDFLEKPITLQRLLAAVEDGLARGRAALLAAANQAALAANRAPSPQALPPAPSTSSDTPSDDHLGHVSLEQPLREARDDFERAYFAYHLACENHSMTRLSEKSGLERTHLYRKLKQLGITVTRRGGVAKIEHAAQTESPGEKPAHKAGAVDRDATQGANPLRYTYAPRHDNTVRAPSRTSLTEPAEICAVADAAPHAKRSV